MPELKALILKTFFRFIIIFRFVDITKVNISPWHGLPLPAIRLPIRDRTEKYVVNPIVEFYIWFMTVQAKEFFLSLLGYAAQRGTDVEALCALAGVNLSALLKNDFSDVAPGNVERCWTIATDLCDDPLFGLHFGESLQIAALGVVGEIIKSSKTVGEALQTAISLVPLVTDKFTMAVSNKGTTSHLYLIANDDKKGLNLFEEQMS